MISVDNLTVSFGGWDLFKDISFLINPKDRIGLVGKNGAGKSTMLKVLIGMQQPTSGCVSRNGDCTIGYLPQQTRAQRDFPATVLEVVLSGCLNRQGLHFFYTPAQRSEAMMNLGKLGILELKDACYRDLSGGQQQRVLLARALCATQKMLLLDEPVSGLDPKVTAEMYTLIERLNREDGITVIMISHDVAAAVRYASHILHIGDTVFFGTKADYLQSPQGRLFDVKKGGDSQ